MLIGTLLANSLLVLGCSLTFGGIRHSHQSLHDLSPFIRANTGLLLLAILAILVPSGFVGAFGAKINVDTVAKDVLHMSRGLAIVLLVVYGIFMVHQCQFCPYFLLITSTDN